MNEIMDPKDAERFAEAATKLRETQMQLRQIEQVQAATKGKADAQQEAVNALVELFTARYKLKDGDMLSLSGEIRRKPKTDPTVAATLKSLTGMDDDEVPDEAGDLAATEG